MKNARTSTLKKYIGDGNFRLSADDRAFLADLAKVRVIDASDAERFHFTDRKTAAERRLNKLCEVGILERLTVNQPGRGQIKVYQFAHERVARLFGGKRPVLSRKRTALHEVITSKIYFAEGRPATFVVEGDFTKAQRDLFKAASCTLSGRESCTPDAMFLRDGEIIVVEADSGQYNKNQIVTKQAAWSDFRQVWGQPARASARVDNATVHLF